jgi:chaperonin GroES
VLLRSDEASAITAGGIMLTEGAIEKPCTATVLAVGPGKKGEDGAIPESQTPNPLPLNPEP